jgi:hypothetical protein
MLVEHPRTEATECRHVDVPERSYHVLTRWVVRRAVYVGDVELLAEKDPLVAKMIDQFVEMILE